MEFKPTPYTKQQFLSKLVIPKDPTYGNPNQVETELKPGQPEFNRAYETSFKDEQRAKPITIGLQDKDFIMIKPTILYWAFALGLGVSWFIFKKNLIQAVIGKEVQIDPFIADQVWFKLNLLWIGYFFFLGCLNWWIAKNFSEDFWANFKLSTIGILFVFILIQGLWLSKYMKQEPKKE